MTAISRRRITVWGFGWGLLTLIALAFAASTYAVYAVRGESIACASALILSFVEWYMFGLLCPAIFALSRRFPFRPGIWATNLGLHFLFASTLGVVHMAAYLSVCLKFDWLESMGMTYAPLLLLYVSKKFAFNLLSYSACVGLQHASELYARYRERELLASQLETRLARAQLDVLKAQLHPHFLFNTLNTVSALMHKDVEAADRVISRLGDLLRLSFESAATQEVVLRQELEFIGHYFEIQQMRFQERLRVVLTADADTLDALVPSLVLQPIVENAVRHGIEPRALGGQVEVRVCRREGQLRIEVVDDGPGLNPESKANAESAACGPGSARRGRGGIGLSNTRARLEQLYGARHRFALENGDHGGLVVSLEIPYRLQGEAAANVASG